MMVPLAYLARLIAATALFGLAATGAQANSDTPVVKKLSSAADLAGWEAVGRLDVANSAFCTAVLLAPDVVLTAAHCLFDPRSGKTVPARQVVFNAGYRNGVAGASVRARAYVLHPEFDYEGDTRGARVTRDLALVQLGRALAPRFDPFDTGDRPRKGSDVAMVSYGKGRAETPVLEDGCKVLARRSGMLVMDCEVALGSSGAPVFQRDTSGQMNVVSVISSALDLNGRQYALGTDLSRPLALLQDLLKNRPPDASAPDPGPAIRRPGPATGTGAKFLRP